MTTLAAPRPEEAADPVADLVAFGFRGWMIGATQADLRAWEAVWRRYCAVLGTVQARVAVTELETWTRRICLAAHRPIKLECLSCPHKTTDECLAVSVIAAAQHRTCPAMRACAFALLDNPNVDPMLEKAEGLADALMRSDQVLAPWSVVEVLAQRPARLAAMH